MQLNICGSDWLENCIFFENLLTVLFTNVFQSYKYHVYTISRANLPTRGRVHKTYEMSKTVT